MGSHQTGFRSFPSFRFTDAQTLFKKFFNSTDDDDSFFMGPLMKKRRSERSGRGFGFGFGSIFENDDFFTSGFGGISNFDDVPSDRLTQEMSTMTEYKDGKKIVTHKTTIYKSDGSKKITEEIYTDNKLTDKN